MDVTGLQSRTASFDAVKANAEAKKEAAKTTAEKKTEEAAADKKQDKFVPSESTPQVTYKKTSGSVSADQLMKMEEQRAKSFQNMLQSMIVKQGQAGNLTLFGTRLNVTSEQSSAAAASIAPGGEYSVDAVAGRIMDMAKALAGGDESKLGTLRTAIQKGFKAAGVDFGQKMPDITNQTYNEVMKRFDDWEKEMKTGAASSAE